MLPDKNYIEVFYLFYLFYFGQGVVFTYIERYNRMGINLTLRMWLQSGLFDANSSIIGIEIHAILKKFCCG